MPLDRREARVEIIGDALRREHRDRMRPQMRVERVAHGVGVPILGEIDMGDLAERVHAGIGAPGAVHTTRSPANAATAVGEHALHR